MVREGIAGDAVTPTLFATMRMTVLEGRGFERTDGPDAGLVAVVNESFVRTYLSGVDPIGVVIRRVENDGERPMRVVGVVADVVQTRAADGPRSAIYVPYTQHPWPVIQAVVRTDLPVTVIAPELRRAAARFNPIVPVQELLAMRDRMAATYITPRFQAFLIGGFALVALLLASAGLYASLTHSVGRRRRELGIRIALGADRATVLQMVLGQGLRVSAIGLALGIPATLALTRLLAHLLFDIAPTDPVTLAGVGAGLVLVSAAACLAPARRATAVDPVTVLRAD